MDNAKTFTNNRMRNLQEEQQTKIVWQNSICTSINNEKISTNKMGYENEEQCATSISLRGIPLDGAIGSFAASTNKQEQVKLHIFVLVNTCRILTSISKELECFHLHLSRPVPTTFSFNQKKNLTLMRFYWSYLIYTTNTWSFLLLSFDGNIYHTDQKWRSTENCGENCSEISNCKYITSKPFMIYS